MIATDNVTFCGRRKRPRRVSVSSDYSAEVQGFFDQRDEVDEIYIPQFCLLECANVIWKQVRFAGVKLEDAEQILTGLQMLRLIQADVEPLLIHTLRIAVSNSLAAYDSAYIALARQLGCPLLTLDDKQGRVAIAEGVALWPLIGDQ